MTWVAVFSFLKFKKAQFVPVLKYKMEKKVKERKAIKKNRKIKVKMQLLFL